MKTNPVSDTFTEMVKLHPNRIAIIDTDGSTSTYEQLDKMATATAIELEEMGLVRGNHISIDSKKSISGVVLLIAAWKVSCSYTFINFSQPSDRILNILNDSASSLVLVCAETNQDNFYKFSSKFQKLNSLGGYVCHLAKPTQAKDSEMSLKYAYIMFTSGSTGKPKGVGITYEQVMRFKDWLSAEFSVSSDDRFTSVNPWYFDNSVFDLYISLLNGCSLVLCDLDDNNSGFTWLKNLIASKPTIWFSVPSLIILISKLLVFSPNNFDNLRFIVFGGEAFPKDILKKVVTDFRGISQAVSVYGPTEGTCICSVNFIKDSDLESEHKYVSLGNFPEFFNYTLKNFIESDDSNSQNLATLFISGPNVTNKYVTHVGQDRFIQDTSGYTQYNTGDLVYLDDETQELYFAGREDNQIKRNGIRIELEEIESIIEGLPGVSGCIAVFDSNKKDDLVAYIEGMVEREPLTRKIRDVLPSYMHPKKIHIIEKLPRNSNGKKDRLIAKRIEMG